MSEKCIIFGCTNEKHQGTFVGDICAPCYEMITKGNLNQPSNNFIYKLIEENKKLRNLKYASARYLASGVS